SIAI
ncbi:TLC ATP/ADP transporter family protein, partial [Chlamydia psittaci 84-8471/1]